MLHVENPFINPIEDVDVDNSAERVGSRIRKIRVAKEMSQAELGESVGLNANRIQQYENGARKPKMDLTKKIASTLEVDPRAIIDPQISNPVGAMYGLFAMEELYDLRLKKIDGQIHMCFGESASFFKTRLMNEYLEAWYDRQQKRDEDISTSNEDDEKEEFMNDYHLWEWNYPLSVVHDQMDSYLKEEELDETKIREQIAELEKKLEKAKKSKNDSRK